MAIMKSIIFNRMMVNLNIRSFSMTIIVLHIDKAYQYNIMSMEYGCVIVQLS